MTKKTVNVKKHPRHYKSKSGRIKRTTVHKHDRSIKIKRSFGSANIKLKKPVSKRKKQEQKIYSLQEIIDSAKRKDKPSIRSNKNKKKSPEEKKQETISFMGGITKHMTAKGVEYTISPETIKRYNTWISMLPPGPQRELARQSFKDTQNEVRKLNKSAKMGLGTGSVNESGSDEEIVSSGNVAILGGDGEIIRGKKEQPLVTLIPKYGRSYDDIKSYLISQIISKEKKSDPIALEPGVGIKELKRDIQMMDDLRKKLNRMPTESEWKKIKASTGYDDLIVKVDSPGSFQVEEQDDDDFVHPTLKWLAKQKLTKESRKKVEQLENVNSRYDRIKSWAEGTSKLNLVETPSKNPLDVLKLTKKQGLAIKSHLRKGTRPKNYSPSEWSAISGLFEQYNGPSKYISEGDKNVSLWDSVKRGDPLITKSQWKNKQIPKYSNPLRQMNIKKLFDSNIQPHYFLEEDESRKIRKIEKAILDKEKANESLGDLNEYIRKLPKTKESFLKKIEGVGGKKLSKPQLMKRLGEEQSWYKNPLTLKGNKLYEILPITEYAKRKAIEKNKQRPVEFGELKITPEILESSMKALKKIPVAHMGLGEEEEIRNISPFVNSIPTRKMEVTPQLLGHLAKIDNMKRFPKNKVVAEETKWKSMIGRDLTPPERKLLVPNQKLFVTTMEGPFIKDKPVSIKPVSMETKFSKRKNKAPKRKTKKSNLQIHSMDDIVNTAISNK